MNTLAPYRLPVYASLAESFETVVLHGGSEANRSWKLEIPPTLRTRQVWTVQLRLRKQTGVRGVWDTQYVHLNAGLLWSLPAFRPDIVLTNELGLRTLIALLYGRLAGVPVWVGWEGTLHSERHISPWKRRFRSWMSGHIRHWISYGKSSSAYLQSLGVPPADLLEVQNCVRQETYQLRPEAPVTWFANEPGPFILSVGQFIPRKGLNTLIDACGRLAARGIAFTLVLVGNGPERDRLQSEAERAGIRHFHLLTNQSPRTLNELYHRADVFVLPTLEDVWGLVVNEALWAGLPVFCSQYAGAAELVPEANRFDPLSAESFDQVLEKVVNHSVAPADKAPMMTWQEVTEQIRKGVGETLPGHGAALHDLGPRQRRMPTQVKGKRPRLRQN